MVENAEQVQGVCMERFGLQHPSIQRLRSVQRSMLVMAQRFGEPVDSAHRSPTESLVSN